MATICFEVHVKESSSYAEWKRVFDDHAPTRAKICDESKTIVGSVSEKLGVVILKEVDMEKMKEMTDDPDFQKMIEPMVEKHVIYTLNPLGP